MFHLSHEFMSPFTTNCRSKAIINSIADKINPVFLILLFFFFFFFSVFLLNMADLTIPTPPRTPTELPTPSSSSASLKASFSNKSTSIKENVQVMVRCRPKSKKELEEEPCWIIDTRQGTIELARITSTARSFQFGKMMK